MARIPLTGGAYESRSLIASAQRCLNLYPEVTPEASDPPTPVTHLLTPGLTTYVRPSGGNGVVRAIHRCTNGVRLVVVGTAVYAINVFTNGVQALTGAISNANTPVSICDNGIVAVITTGGADGYWINIAVNGFGNLVTAVVNTIADAAFFGSTQTVYLDGWFVFLRPGPTNQFYLSPPFWTGTTAFDGTQIASKTGGPDPIRALAVVNGNLWLLGVETTEVWYNSGATDFPFERQPGVLLQHGVHAPWSVVALDVNVLFVGRDTLGAYVVFMSEGYTLKRISNHALENLLSTQAFSANTDAIGMTYQQEGHTFYCLAFPTLDQTWVYDLATGQWHERCYTNPVTGVESRHPMNCLAFWDVGVVVGDYQNGWVYFFDLANGTDNGTAIKRLRSFPHIVADGKRLSHSSLIVDMDVSQVGANTPVSVRWSDDRGANFGTPVTLTIQNSYSSLLLRRLGMARDRVYEISWTFGYPTSLQGVWLEVEKAQT